MPQPAREPQQILSGRQFRAKTPGIRKGRKENQEFFGRALRDLCVLARNGGAPMPRRLNWATAAARSRAGRRWSQSIARVAQRKLKQLDAARELIDLTIFPGNRLETLKGDRAGQHSIRINDQFRICFVWRDRDVHQVEIVDYH
jgi:proteic killer suppression protein